MAADPYKDPEPGLLRRLRPEGPVLPEALFYLLALLAAYYFSWLRFHLLHMPHYPSTFQGLLEGTAEEIFQSRALMLWIGRAIYSLDSVLGVSLTPHRVFKLLEIGSTFALIATYRWFLSFFFTHPGLRCVLAFGMFHVLMYNYVVAWYAPFMFPSDISAIVFFTLGLIMLLKRNWYLYYPLFVLGTLNRETMCFLTFVYVFTVYGKVPRRQLLRHGAAQLAIWISLKALLHYLYGGNPGESIVYNGLRDNVEDLTNPSLWPTLLSCFGYVWLPVVFGFRLLESTFIRRSLWVVIPFGCIMFYNGQLMEFRIYNELVPLVLTAFYLVLAGLFSEQMRQARPADDAPVKSARPASPDPPALP